ncbi:MAG: serine hydrolase domain-containing protein [Candidatus Eisenbacteria bacterium]
MQSSFCAAIVPALLLLVSPAHGSIDDRAAARAIDAYTGPLAARGDLSGQLLVLRGGRVVAERSFGKANLELGTAVGPDTRFNIASVTKPMTAAIAIQLMTEKKMAIADSIARWLPGFPKADSIRVGDLLRHRSGIPHEIVPDSEMTRPYRAAEVVERGNGLKLDFPPGTRSSYSSGGYEVLARVLELVTDRTYDELAAERIFRPLGMTHTLHGDSRALMPGRASGYVPGAHGLENAPLQDFSALVGAGSIWSTARDVRRFVDAVIGGKLGEGVRRSFASDGHLDFNGRTGGFKTWAMWDSVSGVEAIFLGNVASGAPDALKGDIFRILSGEAVTPPVPPVLRTDPTPIAELRRWEGIYQIENGPRLELRVRDGALYSNDWVMWPAQDGAMYSPRDYGVVRLVSGGDGRVTRLDWLQGLETYPAPRVGD